MERGSAAGREQTTWEGSRPPSAPSMMATRPFEPPMHTVPSIAARHVGLRRSRVVGGLRILSKRKWHATPAKNEEVLSVIRDSFCANERIAGCFVEIEQVDGLFCIFQQCFSAARRTCQGVGARS